MDLKKSPLYHDTMLFHQSLSVEKNVRYNSKELDDLLQMLHRIETKLDVLLMQRDRNSYFNGK